MSVACRFRLFTNLNLFGLFGDVGPSTCIEGSAYNIPSELTVNLVC